MRNWRGSMSSKLLKFLYANINGRIGRKTFWLYFILPQWIFFILLGSTVSSYDNVIIATPDLVFYLMILIRIGVFMGFVKRLHDRGKSGWWFILCLIPVIGDIYWFIDLGILPGNKTENKYGASAQIQLETVYNAKA